MKTKDARSCSSFVSRAVLCGAVCGALSLPAVARAEDSPGLGNPPVATNPPEKAALEAEQGTPVAETPKEITVERLPGSAFPQWTTRGLTGGSLWLSGNMHGMPWPYYPRSGIGISGYVWADGGYEKVDRGNSAETGLRQVVNQIRGVFRPTATYSNGSYYIQGQSEIVANGDQSLPQPAFVTVDDLWVRAGEWKKWDVQVGRFEAFEVYHFGMGMDLNTLERQGAQDRVRPLPDVYSLQTVVYRQNGIGNVAFHLYPSMNFRFELLGQFGFDASSAVDTIGVRPAGIYDVGWFKLKVAADMRKQFGISTTSKESRFSRGWQAAVQFVVQPYIEFGGNFALGLVDHYNAQNTLDSSASMGDYDGVGSTTNFATGGFANVRLAEGLLAGAGFNYVKETDQVTGSFVARQGFLALQYAVMGQLFVKVVGGYADADLAPGGSVAWQNHMKSGRVRLLYLF